MGINLKGLRIISNSPEETESAGYSLGKVLKIFGKTSTIYLFGDLGSGKTVFVKGLGNAFGIPPRDIGSASFIIVAQYDTSPPFYHIDLYRIEGDSALESIGIWEYIDGDGITTIEWADRISEIPEEGIKVIFKILGETSREINIEGIDEKDWHNIKER